jgi:hypothetical protein
MQAHARVPIDLYFTHPRFIIKDAWTHQVQGVATVVKPNCHACRFCTVCDPSAIYGCWVEFLAVAAATSVFWTAKRPWLCSVCMALSVCTVLSLNRVCFVHMMWPLKGAPLHAYASHSINPEHGRIHHCALQRWCYTCNSRCEQTA